MLVRTIIDARTSLDARTILDDAHTSIALSLNSKLKVFKLSDNGLHQAYERPYESNCDFTLLAQFLAPLLQASTMLL